MTRTHTYRILSLFLAFLVLTSSVSFAIDIHFCGDKVHSINIFGKAKTCSMLEQNTDTSSKHKCCEKKNDQQSHCKMESKKKDCCHNEQFTFEQDNDFKLNDASTVNLEDISPVLVYVLINNHFLEFETTPTFYSFYDPPVLSKNLLVQQQVFRI